MHEPQCSQVCRSGPAPPKYGSTPDLPKYTPTRVGWYESPTPIRSATVFTASSARVVRPYVATPSIRSAWL
jgi:hypothetical protein